MIAASEPIVRLFVAEVPLPLEWRTADAMLPMMFRLVFIRLRAVMLFLAFSLSLAGQAVAGVTMTGHVTMTGQMSSALGEPVVVTSGAAICECSDCDDVSPGIGLRPAPYPPRILLPA